MQKGIKSVPHLVDPSIHTLTIEPMDSLSFIHTDQETRPLCSSLWFHLKSLYLDRRGKVLDGWWGCGTCGWVVNFPLLHGPHRSFFFANRQSSLADRLDGPVAQRSTFEQNGVGRFYSFKSSDGQNGLCCVDNCTTYHPQWYLFSVFFWLNIFTLWGIFYFFQSFISGANFWKRYSTKEEMKVSKRNAFFFIHSLGFIYDEVLLCRQHFIF